MKTKDNFYLNTKASFWRVRKAPDREPDFVSKKPVYFEEDDEWDEITSSRYWYTEDGVYRKSDHWGRVASCEWKLISGKKTEEKQVGFCRWSDFDKEVLPKRIPKTRKPESDGKVYGKFFEYILNDFKKDANDITLKAHADEVLKKYIRNGREYIDKSDWKIITKQLHKQN